jgi:Succinate dehydrogenase/Fumarate reductase transmembrane subunit
MNELFVFSIIPSNFSYLVSTVQTQSLKPDDGAVILNTQRLARPSSPHFTIYQPQLTWLGSIANRVTGVGLSVCASILLYFPRLFQTADHARAQCSMGSLSPI